MFGQESDERLKKINWGKRCVHMHLKGREGRVAGDDLDKKECTKQTCIR